LFLTKLSLSQYRNYDQLLFETNKKVNIFVGSNAQGKTNLIESIYVLALTKSHRTSQDKELIRWNEIECKITAEVEKKYGLTKFQFSITNAGKKAKINGLEQKRLSGYVGMLNVVLFAPEDLEIVKGGPAIRRRFLDMEIGQVYPGYLFDLMQYHKVLLQRNNFLKQNPKLSEGNKTMMEVLNEQLVQFGIKIMKKRQSFIETLQTWAEQTHSGITGGKEKLKITYQPSYDCDVDKDETVLFDQYMLKLSKVRDQELRRGMTIVGPHRDDLLFAINGKDVQTFGSQGQQRTTALSLKLAELELIHEETGEYPLLLLDDVLSELDRSRQTQLIETFQDKVQIFITTTGIEALNMEKLNGAAIFDIHGASIRQRL
jgi:DNA replication and repair protein RecF